jgi:DNA-binding MarR family transcriptional regulator
MKRADTYEAIEALMRLSQLVERRRRQLARDAGLTSQQWAVLEEIAREDFMPSLFARGRSTSAAAVSRTLRQLLDPGLVSVSISRGDARQRDYAVTAKGRRALEMLASDREDALAVVWDDLAPAETRRFGRFAERLADRLEAYAEDVERRG